MLGWREGCAPAARWALISSRAFADNARPHSACGRSTSCQAAAALLCAIDLLPPLHGVGGPSASVYQMGLQYPRACVLAPPLRPQSLCKAIRFN